ncbi:hypothetical protein JRO89_XS11G0010300 [Xanthoceras sorbifolium]|uniref:PB1 domain-containing protein n=1 Tax=Xanthoceras sorbifolium TaxID=99658 RepID=A0ABQ8HE86_9ROSI|nr:hypothetical protein JRO89_XS11G0010300 [Xanthoceras sorbifolium]
MDMMDPRPQPQPQAAVSKLRIMCSYGGHIVPVPHKHKSFFYAGGDTRIISVPASVAATFSAFSAHIAAALRVGYPFALKYQLPLNDLDSLISLSSDEDLLIFLEELHRLSSSPPPAAPARIRLFLVPFKQQGGDHELAVCGGGESTQPGLTHPKTESWFVDALKGAKMMQQKGEMGGFGGEGGQSEGLCGQESLMLETTSSFGSSSSSVSLSNLPPIKACGGGGDETLVHYQDNKTMLPSTESTASDTGSVTCSFPCGQTVTDQGPVFPVAAMENNVNLNPTDLSDTKIPDLVPGLPVPKTVQYAGYPLSTQLDQLQQQQWQCIQMGNPMSTLPVTSYYPTYNKLPSHQPLQYLSNQPYPVYVVPVGQAQAYNASPQYCSKETMQVIGRPPLHPNTSAISPQVAYKEVIAVPPIPGFVSQVYRTTPVANSPVHVPYNNENKQQNGVAPQMHNQTLPIGVTSRETANYSNEHDNDAARAHIYKSQPPPPALPSQYQAMTNATTILMSD